ncbi:MAG: type II 3-dehydroquinate dehydratase [Magnetococcales bacterium]|nr:type II 3-dehydroquinate dehydratase [Magnetococcales bacterium]
MNGTSAPPWRILVINGPNLNLLGRRETGIYGAMTLADIESACRRKAESLGVEIDFHQSNHEGELVERIQAAMGVVDGIIINPAAYTHTSIAIRDALLAVNLPVMEVHLSNIHRREAFRHHSYISDIAEGVIAGLGADGYLYALDAVVRHLVARVGP